VYSKWIDGADRSRERDKLNVGFGHDFASDLIAEAKKLAQSGCEVAEREGFEATPPKGSKGKRRRK
jgi:hypothetical protein